MKSVEDTPGNLNKLFGYNIFKTRDITLPTKVHIVKAIVFIVVMLEKEMATHSSTLAWKIPGTVEPGGLPSMGSHRVRQ